MLPAAATEADAVLIDGPFLTGKRHLFHSLLRSWTDELVIASTRHVDCRVRRTHTQATDGSTGDPVVVDCVSAAHRDDIDETPQTRYAAGPGNLTAIGTTVTNVLESRRGEDLAVGVAALSPLVTYTSVQTAFKFTRVLVSQATGQGWPVAAVAATPMFDDPNRRALRDPFETVIETQPADSGGASDGATGTERAMFRVRSRETITDWQPVSSV